MLKRAVLAFKTPELAAAGLISSRIFLHNARIEVLSTFSLDDESTTLVIQATRRPGAPSLASIEAVERDLLKRYDLQSLEVLEADRQGRECTLLVRQRNSDSLRGILQEVDEGIFPVAPCVLEEATTLFGLCAPEGTLRGTLGLFRRLGLRYEVRSIGPYRYGTRGVLTPRQATAVGLALDLGFFAIPRRTDLRTLGKILAISPVALGKLLRRAEEGVLKEALGRPQ